MRNNGFIRGAFMVFGFVAITGCSGLNSSAMMPMLTTGKTHVVSVDIQVAGHKIFTENGGGKDALNAISKAVQDSVYDHVFLRPDGARPAKLKLNVLIHQIVSPIVGLTMETSLEISWLLTSGDAEKILYRRSIRTSDKKTIGDAFVGATRARMAFESAMRENIRIAIEDMEKVKL